MISSNTLPSSVNPLDLYTKNQLCSISANMWSRPATALLIEMYRKLECLWKTNSVYYRNKKKRFDALQEIATAITPFRPDTTIDDVKNKINGIRTQYAAEKNKISFYAKKNPSMDYEPSLWCYDRLSFLAPYTTLKNKPAAGENAGPQVTVIETAMLEKQPIFQIKLESNDDQAEITGPEDMAALSESNEECDSSQQIDHYISEPYAKRARTQFDKEKLFVSSLQPEVTLTKSVKYRQPWLPGEELAADEPCFQPRQEESFSYSENDEWIEVFGKFVTTQMKLITDKTLLIKLQHTIQTAIMDAQLKQIEFDRQ